MNNRSQLRRVIEDTVAQLRVANADEAVEIAMIETGNEVHGILAEDDMNRAAFRAGFFAGLKRATTALRHALDAEVERQSD
jgi:hypothetical protein